MGHDQPKNRLVLGTWFTPYLRGLPGGGLPNEFLVNGGAELLLYDEVLCDPFALEQELKYWRWLTPRIFRDLARERVLKPIPKRDMEAFVAARNRLLMQEERLSRLVALMQSRLEQLERTLRAGARDPAFVPGAVEPELIAYNEEMLDAFAKAVGGAVPYGWRGRATVWASGQTNGQANQLVSLERAVAQILGVRSTSRRIRRQVPLVPPIVGAGQWALRQNMRAERMHTLRWQYADPTFSVEDYETFRKSRRFWAADGVIDRSRDLIARRNLDVLLEVRRRTEDIRTSALAKVDGLLNDSDPQRTLGGMMREEIDYMAQEYAGGLSSVHHRKLTATEFALPIAVALAVALFETRLGASPWVMAAAAAASEEGTRVTAELVRRRSHANRRARAPLTILGQEYGSISRQQSRGPQTSVAKMP